MTPDAPPEPAFAAPWHAQLFALTVAMNEAGHFQWTEWAERFGKTLAKAGLSRDLDGGDDYFGCWLETFEALLREKDVADPALIEQFRAAWESAYLSTPHGAPVRLP